MRARNENVYPGVLLDRTVIVTKGYIIDAFRVISADEHQYDWAAHCAGDMPVPADAAPVKPGDRRGYVHLADARLLQASISTLYWPRGGGQVALHLVPPDGATLILASDPLNTEKGYGGLAPLDPHTILIARVRCRSAVFLALWQVSAQAEPLNFTLREGDAASDLTLQVETDGATMDWLMPYRAQPVKRGAVKR
jgi:hypothetical protein